MYMLKRSTNEVFGQNTVTIDEIRRKFSVGEYAILVGRRDGDDAMNRKTFIVGASTLEKKLKTILYTQLAATPKGAPVQKNVGKEFHIDNIFHIRNGIVVWSLKFDSARGGRRSTWIVQS